MQQDRRNAWRRRRPRRAGAPRRAPRRTSHAAAVTALLHVALVLPASASSPVAPCVAVPAVDDRCEQWVSLYDNPNGHARGPNIYTGLDEAADLVVSPDGSRVYVTGASYDNRTQIDYVTLAYDVGSGAKVWEQHFDGRSTRNDLPAAIALSGDGTVVFVTGLTQDDTTSNDYGTVAYDAATGAPLWTAFYTSPGANDDRVRDVVVTPDGGTVVVGGQTGRGSGNTDYAVVAYDAATGAQRWEATFDYPGELEGEDLVALAVDPRSRTVYVAGHGIRGKQLLPTTLLFDHVYVALAYDVGTGELRWRAEYVGGEGLDIPTAIAVSPGGGTVVLHGIATPASSSSSTYGIVAFEAASGRRQWVASYGGSGALARTGDVAVDDSRVYATGAIRGPTGRYEYATVALTLATGDVAWASRYALDVSGSSVQGGGIAVSPDRRRVYVAGHSQHASRNLVYSGFLQESVTLAYDAASGAQAWAARYRNDPAGSDLASARAVTVTPDSRRVLVLAQIRHSIEVDDRHLLTPFELSNSSDIATLAYAA